MWVDRTDRRATSKYHIWKKSVTSKGARRRKSSVHFFLCVYRYREGGVEVLFLFMVQVYARMKYCCCCLFWEILVVFVVHFFLLRDDRRYSKKLPFNNDLTIGYDCGNIVSLSLYCCCCCSTCCIQVQLGNLVSGRCSRVCVCV